MKFCATIIILNILILIVIPDLSFTQPLLTIEEIQYQHPDSLLLYGDRPSPYNGQTVKLRGVVMVSPLVNAQTDRRPIIWVGTRWSTYLNDPSGQVYENFDGLHILQMDTSIQYHGTFFDLIDTAQVVEITLTINEYYVSTQGDVLINPISPVSIIQQLPKRPDPIELSIADFMSGGVLNPLAEEYEGQYVVIRNVITSDRNTFSGTFKINDGLGNYMTMFDQSGYFTLRAHRLTGLTTYQPPADGITLGYIRGLIQTREGGYYIIPLYPGDIREIQTFPLIVNVANGWNMVSIPGLHLTDQNVNTWWAFRDPGANVFRYAGGYQTVTDAVPGTGYWMKHAGARTYNTGGEWPVGGIQIVAHDPITAAGGWNLFGGYELSVTAANVTTNPPGLQSGPIYKYSGGYQPATTIDPGYGYWIKLTGAGQIIIPETLTKGEDLEWFPKEWGRIVITDNAGHSYKLYAVSDKKNIDLSTYELPPAPPEGMFDIRFSSGRIAEDINSSIKAIDMSGVTYPLTVRVEGMDIRLMDESGKIMNVNLKDGEDVVIDNSTINKLMVSGKLLPTVYSLEQNYPNPFNPSTMIEFSLPEDVASVKLSIYNALGEKVAELVNTSLRAGKYQYQWNAKDVATGMYIYELRTDKFISVKKMVLIK